MRSKHEKTSNVLGNEDKEKFNLWWKSKKEESLDFATRKNKADSKKDYHVPPTKELCYIIGN